MTRWTTPRGTAACLGICFLGLASAPTGSAGLAAQTFERGENSFWSLYWENDTFYDTDQSYTNGSRIVFSVESLDPGENRWWLPDDLVRRVFQPSCDIDPDLCWEWSGGWVIGQNFYTPQDITIADLIEDDRPYGGWLYLGKMLHVSRPDVGDLGDFKATQHTFEVDVGVTGDLSFSDETQTFVHEHVATGAPEPRGWDHQIQTEPGIVLQYVGKQRAIQWTAFDRRAFDVIPEWTVVAGNIFTYGGGGVTARLGWNLGDDFGPSRIQPVAPMMARQGDFEAYGFASVGARVVAHNIFLDGGWFGDDPHTVSKEGVVGDAELGAFVRFKRIGASFRWVRRTPEFRERRISQEYGALNLIILY